MARTYYAQADAAGVLSIRRAPHDGLMTIATGSRHHLTKLVQVASRHGWAPGVYLVPGIPEAANRTDAMDKEGRSTSIERFQRTAEALAGEAAHG